MRFVLYGCPACQDRWWIRDGKELNPGHDCPDDYPHAGIRLETVETVFPEPEQVA